MVADLLSKTEAPIRFAQWQGTYAVAADTDILVNATSIGLYPDVDSMPPVNLDDARPGMLVCDVVFNPPETMLIRRGAANAGCPSWTACRCWSIRERSGSSCGRDKRRRNP